MEKDSGKIKTHYIKVILLGETGIGKTSLINIYLNREFNPSELSNTNLSQSFANFELNDIKLNVSFWDTMGQEKYRSLTKTFIKGSNIVIFVYDITRIETLLELDYWLNTVIQEIGNDEVIFGVVGNKIDLFNECEVEQEEGKKYASKIDALFCETSAKNNPKGFKYFIRQLLEQYLLKNKIVEKIDENENDRSFHLENDNNNNDRKNKKCCK